MMVWFIFIPRESERLCLEHYQQEFTLSGMVQLN
jgi:hypothetical protein